MDLRKFAHRWFALQVKTRYEEMCAHLLRDRGYEDFVPLSKSESLGGALDRGKKNCALFPGYIFCRLNPDAEAPMVTTPGVVRVLGYGGVPNPVTEQEIENLRIFVRSGLHPFLHPYVSAGQYVRIERGPLRGIVGVVVRTKASKRVVVSVDLLQRSVAVEIDLEWTSPLMSAASTYQHPT